MHFKKSALNEKYLNLFGYGHDIVIMGHIASSNKCILCVNMNLFILLYNMYVYIFDCVRCKHN